VELLRPTTEEDAAATFLRAELESPRFRDDILAGRRGWRLGGLFHGFPEDFEWYRAELAPEEVLAIRYIDWDWWLTISGGTRSPAEAAARIRAGAIDGVVAESHRPLAERLRSANPPPELIAVTTTVGEPLVLVEGHARLTAYAVYPAFLPPRLEIVVGISPRAAEWSNY
jgi:hypothetical protein